VNVYQRVYTELIIFNILFIYIYNQIVMTNNKYFKEESEERIMYNYFQRKNVITQIPEEEYNKYINQLNFKAKYKIMQELADLGVKQFKNLYFKSIEELEVIKQISMLQKELETNITFKINTIEDNDVMRFILKREIKKQQNHNLYLKKATQKEFDKMCNMYDI
jgi:hypothetical protein